MKKIPFPWPCCLQWAPPRDILPPPSVPSPPNHCCPLHSAACSWLFPVSSISYRGHSALATRQRVALGGQKQENPLRDPTSRSVDMPRPRMLITCRRKRAGFPLPHRSSCLSQEEIGVAEGAGDPGSLRGSTTPQPAAEPHSPPQGARVSLSSVTQNHGRKHAGEGAGPHLTVLVSWPRTRRNPSGREAAWP